jgi:hypothetical protein
MVMGAYQSSKGVAQQPHQRFELVAVPERIGIAVAPAIKATMSSGGVSKEQIGRHME